ncbi:carboxypeptidase-like regulatory domain-containing protein [Spirosoma aerolatum]|uniref:carboxypeptidase-like regulatory domain-containing protein n=1 Tax=Spirosoma aerolatum TaxID=1211326 RepID=UPI0009ACE39E|nr:carboxypeptidase-like regulatory domain-containing protein [Spirosoma aerolatum]
MTLTHFFSAKVLLVAIMSCLYIYRINQYFFYRYKKSDSNFYSRLLNSKLENRELTFTLLKNVQDKTIGRYTLVKRKNNTSFCFIKGQIFDKETGESLKIAAVEVKHKIINADTNGLFSFKVLPGNYKVTGLCYPYHRLTTKTIKVKAGETININFWLLIDKIPLE